MKTFIITDSESKITLDKGEKARRCATVLNYEEARQVAETILADIIKRENVK